MSSKSVKLSDIAAKAGVSITTVSHVINGTRNVKKETRDEVLRILAELNYTRESRVPVGKKNITIGFIAANIVEDYSMAVLKFIETYTAAQGITLFFCDSELDSQKERANIRVMLERKVDGLILAPVNSDLYPEELASAGFPVVLIDRQYANHTEAFVGINNFRSGLMATRYLTDKNCEKIGFIGYDPLVSTVQQRAMGYRASLQELSPPRAPAVLSSAEMRSDVNRAIVAFVHDNRLDGVLCATSDNCYQLVSALDEVDPACLHALKIVTYDDNKWLDFLKYPVSVVTQPTAEIGLCAIETLLQMINAPDDTRWTGSEVLLNTDFIDRL